MTVQFISTDPLLDTGDPLSVNGYTYANSNPINLSDPSGMAAACVGMGTCTYTDNPAGGPPTPGPDRTLPAADPADTEQTYLNLATSVNNDYQLGNRNDTMMTVHGEWVDAGDIISGYYDTHPETWDNTLETALRIAVFDPDSCQAATVSCGVEILGILPFGKLAKVTKVVDAFRNADRVAEATKVAETFGKFGASDIRTAAEVIDRNGLTRAGRALQKHSGRQGSVFGNMSSGTAVARNEQGMRVLDEILTDPASTTEVLDNVTNIWDASGRGIRMGNDGTFMGFLEPLS
ncbi:hypothetical protein [Nocardioides sp. YIM 152315]|uniref:hypothetical protein n=1 Tax=Nocardioides sp. YIM 152315 TaxID=3031760 RepID=UPI0023DAF7A3|nr:hypothetical protein [Nocardioides sp. YIM 152315]MDF1605812.1 hypothetical protein [Nocardioides sp. YIM 152315]